MKNKVTVSCLALSLLLGGATFSSASAATPPKLDHSIHSPINLTDSHQVKPQFWSSVTRGLYWLGQKYVSDPSNQSVFGKNTPEPMSDYDYEELKEIFDL